MSVKKLSAIHPGEILLEAFLKPMEISQYRIAKEMCVPPRRINEIVHGLRSITADTALRLSTYFDTSAQFWLNLQTRFDLENERDKSLARIEKEVLPFGGVKKRAAWSGGDARVNLFEGIRELLWWRLSDLSPGVPSPTERGEC